MKYIKIRKGILEDGANFSDDVIQTKKHLNTLGYYNVPEYGLTEYPDKDLFRAIKSYQKDKNLTVDGKIFPDGETQKSLNTDIDNQDIAVRSPVYWCIECGAPHGGAFGDICWDCHLKS